MLKKLECRSGTLKAKVRSSQRIGKLRSRRAEHIRPWSPCGRREADRRVFNQCRGTLGVSLCRICGCEGCESCGEDSFVPQHPRKLTDQPPCPMRLRACVLCSTESQIHLSGTAGAERHNRLAIDMVTV